jgi:hypothetical protein
VGSSCSGTALAPSNRIGRYVERAYSFWERGFDAEMINHRRMVVRPGIELFYGLFIERLRQRPAASA